MSAAGSGVSVAEVPVGVRANMVPAEIVVFSNLAEDTVVAHGMNIAAGVNKQALFANPLSGGGEEMLFVDSAGSLWWVRHVNPDGVVGQPAWAPRGWVVEQVDIGLVTEVVVVVHPTGRVVAFVLVDSTDPRGGSLMTFELVAAPAVQGGQRWKQDIYITHDRPLAGLQVYYCNDRPATPFVFVTDPSEPRLLWYAPSFPSDPAGLLWHRGGEFAFDPADKGVPVVAGVDSPVEVGAVPAVSAVRLWSVVEGGLFLTSHFPAEGPGYNRWDMGLAWTGLVGAFAHPAGAGVVGTTGAETLQLAVGLDGIGQRIATVALDQPLGDLVAWQDAENHLHLYGRDQKAVLNAVHQTGWVDSDQYGLKVPVWDQHQANGTAVATTRPLVGRVATYAIDAFPDFMPNQHVMHQGVVASEACAIYTQDVRTSFWSQEKIRIVPGKDSPLPAPNTVPRYQTSLVVKDGYGAPMPGVGVELSADVPVDLEVAGQFYRTGAVTPITLTTDLRGQVTLRVVAAGLTVPDLYVTVPGLDQSLTLQMAADVHKFLAGNATLPNHGDGFTPQVVQDATIPGTTTKLFSKIAPTDTPADTPADWKPTAEEVVTWCAGAFAVDTNLPLPTAMTAGLAEGEQVLAFTLQTHDPDRPGYQVFTHPDQLEARRQTLHANGGTFTDFEDWVGDILLGIRQGVIEVTEATIYSEEDFIEFVVRLADGTLNILGLTWDDVLGAAHAVEAAFVALGAKINDTLDWLKWAFDFKDAFLTAKAMTSAIGQLSGLVTPVLENWQHLAHGYFIDQEAAVTQTFESLKGMYGGQAMTSLDTPTSSPAQTTLPAEGSDVASQANGPHAGWLTEKITGVEGSTGTIVLPNEVSALVDDLWGILTSSPKAVDKLKAAWNDFGTLFSNLFDGDDAQTFVAQELVTVLDLLENVVLAILIYADDVVAGILGWTINALKEIETLLSMPLVDVPVISLLWDFMVSHAGLDPKDHPLTVGALGTMIGAYPITILYKMIMAEAPFPDGVFPTLPTDTEIGADPGQAVLKLHVVAGLGRMVDILYYPLLDGRCFADHPPLARSRTGMDVGVGPLGPSRLWSISMSTVHLFTWGVLELPAIYRGHGQPEPPAAQVRWAAEVALAVANFGASVAYGSPLERFRVGDGVRTYTGFACAVTCVVGFVRFYATMAAASQRNPDSQSWFDKRNKQLSWARTLPGWTGFSRTMYDFAQSQVTGIAVLADAAVGATALAYSGVGLITQALYELNSPPKIQGSPGPIVLPDCTRNRPYESQPIKVSGGYPRYSWSAGLLDGLVLQDATPPDSDYPGQVMKIVGTTSAPAGTYDGELMVQDNYYGPRGVDRIEFKITLMNPT